VLSRAPAPRGLVVVLAASVAVAWGARRYVTTSPRFAVRTVLVDGRRSAGRPRSPNARGRRGGQERVLARSGSAPRQILAGPLDREGATATRKLPGHHHDRGRSARPTPSAHRRRPLPRHADGELFKKLEPRTTRRTSPSSRGSPPSSSLRDRPGVASPCKRVLEVADELERVGVAKRYPIQEVHLEKDGSLVGHHRQGGDHPPARLCRRSAKDRAGRAACSPRSRRRKADASMIFLDNDAHPERVVVRMR
jgi:cell division protein FtsQ